MPEMSAIFKPPGLIHFHTTASNPYPVAEADEETFHLFAADLSR